MIKPNTPEDRGEDGLTAEEREVGTLVRSLAEHFRRETWDRSDVARRMMRDASIGPRHVRVLYELRDAPLSVGEIAARLGVELSTASQLTGELRRAEILEAERDPRDGRRVVLSLKESVRTEAAAFFESRIDPMRKALDSLSDRERKAFLKGLRAWVEALGAKDPMA